MKLFLVRHAEAEPMRVADSQRALTARGHQQSAETAQWLAMSVQQPCMLISSPYQRAMETAAAIQRVLPQATWQVAEHLTPENVISQAVLELEAVANSEIVIVVSHMPVIAGLAGWLEHGAVTAGSPFALAEARLFELEWPGPGVARGCDRFVPVG